MKSVIDDEIDTMSMTTTATEAPIEADKYDSQFDINEEKVILSKIKGNFFLLICIKLNHCVKMQYLFRS